MVEIIWTSQAYNDLKEINDFIALDSQKLATYTVDKIFNRTLILGTFPLIGRIVPEIQSIKIRELIEGRYRIVYEIMGDEIILIQTVRHSSRDFDKTIFPEI